MTAKTVLLIVSRSLGVESSEVYWGLDWQFWSKLIALLQLASSLSKWFFVSAQLSICALCSGIHISLSLTGISCWGAGWFGPSQMLRLETDLLTGEDWGVISLHTPHTSHLTPITWWSMCPPSIESSTLWRASLPALLFWTLAFDSYNCDDDSSQAQPLVRPLPSQPALEQTEKLPLNRCISYNSNANWRLASSYT